MTKLVKMYKADETLAVHPSTVAAHEVAGWSVGEADAPAEPEPAGKSKSDEKPAAE